jgi:Na+/H+ antiporter NhaC
MFDKDNGWHCLVLLLFIGLAMRIIFYYQGLSYIISALLIIASIIGFIWYREIESNKDKLNDSRYKLQDKWKE